jgi:hypothetical protein
MERLTQDLAYDTPTLEDRGDLTDLTAEQTTGDTTDAAFPPGTPKGDITFT